MSGAGAMSLRLRFARFQLGVAGALPKAFSPAPSLPAKPMGLAVRNPVGLAAGMDRTGRLIEGARVAGFGFMEIGSVTPETLPAVSRILSRSIPGGDGTVVGLNIGCARGAGDATAIGQYLAGVRACLPLADYLVLNLSSPFIRWGSGTRGSGREALFSEAVRECERYHRSTGAAPPLAVKLRLDSEGAMAVLRSARDAGFAGAVLATVSGLPEAKTLDMLSDAGAAVPEMSLIAVGGIADARQVQARLDRGMAAVQVFSVIVDRGIGVPRSILTGLARRGCYGNAIAGEPA